MSILRGITDATQIIRAIILVSHYEMGVLIRRNLF
jgi:hypothetical protein